jgi:hypothetical protein
MMSEIQRTIQQYGVSPERLSNFTVRCFVGMLETGEATEADFEAVGGQTLVDVVVAAKAGNYPKS